MSGALAALLAVIDTNILSVAFTMIGFTLASVLLFFYLGRGRGNKPAADLH
ncbi:hypothetical protein BH11ARM1_BH11ARM1_04260 [soil metagenome]